MSAHNAARISDVTVSTSTGGLLHGAEHQDTAFRHAKQVLQMLDFRAAYNVLQVARHMQEAALL